MNRNRALVVIGIGLLGAVLGAVEDQAQFSAAKQEFAHRLHDAMPKNIRVYADSGRDDIVKEEVEKVR